MQLKKFCNNCKKTTTHEPDASLLITNYGNKIFRKFPKMHFNTIFGKGSKSPSEPISKFFFMKIIEKY